MTDISFSVIIPIYNNMQTALRAVFSVLRQTHLPHEIILVDDCSSKDYKSILFSWLVRRPSPVPIVLHRLDENVGPGLARHYGANHARGRYVAFLDADDLWHSQKLEQAAQIIKQTNACLIGHSRPWCISSFKRSLVQPLHAPPYKELRRLDFIKRNPIPTSSIVVTSTIAKSMFRNGGRRSEDYTALVLAAGLSKKIVFLNAPLCWASKPPFGTIGEGSNQIEIYKHSFYNFIGLFKARDINHKELAIFMIFLLFRAPIGLIRQGIYSKKFKDKVSGIEIVNEQK